MQTYCISPSFKCPNYGNSWACPPEAPYLEKEVSQFKRFFLIYHEFDLASYVKEQKAKYPKRNEQSIRNNFYAKDYMRDELEREILKFLENYNENFEVKLVLWDGFCRVCSNKKDNGCARVIGKPCRYPDKKRYSMEAIGIHVTQTVKNLNLEIEWPPINYYYRFGLVCFK